MSNTINRLFDQNFGIQDILQFNTDNHMPTARPLASTVMNEAGLDSLYSPVTASRLLEAMMRPSVGDGDLTRPEIFEKNIQGTLQNLEGIDNPAVKNFLNEILTPLVNNTSLLQAYSGLMIQG